MPHVTVPDEPTLVVNVVTTSDDGPFNFAFSYFSANDIQVYNGTSLVDPADYTLTPAVSATGGYEGGSITLDVAVSNTTITILRAVPIERTTDFPTSGPFPIDTLNSWIDKVIAIQQQQQTRLDRSIHVGDSDPDSFTATLPGKTARANKALVFDANGNVDVSTDDYEDQATDAAASAAAAASSASAASTSASGAATSATNASTSASTASTQASNASTSATNASTSATNAATSATNAASAAASVAHRFTYDTTTTMGDGGTGVLRFNNATVASVTAIAVTAESADSGNPDISDFVATWDDSTNTTIKGTITIRKLGTPATFAIFTVSAVTDNGAWLQLTVAHVSSGGSWSNSDTMVVGYSRTGNKGADGAGTVSSVTAGDASITVGGTAADPIVRVRDVAATSRILGRKSASAGIMEDCTLSEVLDFIGSAAQGDILYRGSSSWARLGAGTSGHFLKTQGAAANPTWAAASGTMTLISSTAIGSSAVSDVTITGLSLTTYPVLVIDFSGLEPTNDLSALYCQIGTSGGIHSSSNYHSYAAGIRSDSSPANSSGAGSAQWRLTGPYVRSSTYGGISGRMILFGNIDSSMLTNMTFQLSFWRQPDNVGHFVWGGGTMNNSGVDPDNFDRIKFYYDTGNLKYGRITIYGMNYA